MVSSFFSNFPNPFNRATPPVDTTPATPADDTVVPPPAADATPATPAVETTPATPAVETTPATPAVETTPATPAVETTPAVQTQQTAVVVDSITQAKLALTGKGQSKVDALYEETVTKASNIFNQLGGWICFHFGKASSTSAYGEALKEDKKIEVAAKDFNDAVTTLIDAAFRKTLSPAESANISLPERRINVESFSALSFEENRALAANDLYNQAVEKFNTAFQAAYVALNPTPSDESIKNFMKGAIVALTEEKETSRWARSGNSTEVLKLRYVDLDSDGLYDVNGKRRGSLSELAHASLPDVKFDMAVGSFVNSVYHNDMKLFAQTAPEALTIELIATKLAHFLDVFPGNTAEKVLKDMILSLYGNPAIADAARALLDPATIQAEIDRRAGINQTEIDQLAAELRTLQRSAEGVNGRGELDKAWKDWRGYTTTGTQAVDAEGRPVAGKVVIQVNGESVEVAGKTGQDELGRAIRSNQVYVFGKEQLALFKLRNFLTALNRAPTGEINLDNPTQLAGLLLGLDPATATADLLRIQGEARDAWAARETAKALFLRLDARQKEIVISLSEKRAANDVAGIRTTVTTENRTNHRLLDVFVRKSRNINADLNQSYRALNGRLRTRERELAATAAEAARVAAEGTPAIA